MNPCGNDVDAELIESKFQRYCICAAISICATSAFVALVVLVDHYL